MYTIQVWIGKNTSAVQTEKTRKTKSNDTKKDSYQQADI